METKTNNIKENKNLLKWLLISRIVLIVLTIIIIVILIKEIEAVKLLGMNVCEICSERTNCHCFCLNEMTSY